MLRASYFAGCAFTKSYALGYVHAVCPFSGRTIQCSTWTCQRCTSPHVLETQEKQFISWQPLLLLPVASKKHGRKSRIKLIRRSKTRRPLPESAIPVPKSRKKTFQSCHTIRTKANPLYPVLVLMDAGAGEILYADTGEENTVQ